MPNPWFRLWTDMPTDPKWRTIARVSGQSISVVQAVFLQLMVSASNANERGRTQTNAEDIGSALDERTESIQAVLDAMHGRVMDGDHLTGWETRQPKREDSSAERAKTWRERNRTQSNAIERNRTLDKKREEEKREEKPSRAKREQSDARHASFKTAVTAYAAQTRVQLQWDGSEAKALDLLLKSAPLLTLAEFQTCLNHRARSAGVAHGERPRLWLPHVLKYQQGALTVFGKAEVQGHNEATVGMGDQPKMSEAEIEEFRSQIEAKREARRRLA